MAKQEKKALRVAFLHPDLGIGGAERLIIDAALALKSRGHSVSIFTSHHDPSHAFGETTDGQLSVAVHGDFLPRGFISKFHVLFASIRNLYCALMLCFFTNDVIFVDQISTSVPLLRLLTSSRVVFYCHFPDKLLSLNQSKLKALYRVPFDFLEEVTTGCAHVILVNSEFTARVYAEAFPRLRSRPPRVLYPSVPTPSLITTKRDFSLVVSLNRYERKKRVDLAIRAIAELKVKLVVAGGYDVRVRENVEYKRELEALAKQLGVADRVTFECSVSDDRRSKLLRSCLCLLYTPPNEHFGIVPLEAMALGCPVVAVNSGGPLETVRDGHTGFLVDPTPPAFATAIAKLGDDPSLAEAMSRQARDHLLSNFSFDRFATTLESFIT